MTYLKRYAFLFLVIFLAGIFAFIIPPTPTFAADPTTVSLSADQTNVPVNTSVTLTATTDQDVGPTPYVIAIYENGLSRIVACSTGTTCTISVTSSTSTTKTYQATIENPADGTVLLRSNFVDVTWTPAVSWSVSLLADQTNVPVNTSVTLTATANQDVGPTPYVIAIYEGATSIASCSSGTTCTISVTSSTATTKTYFARIEEASDPNIFPATSNFVDVTWTAIAGAPTVNLLANGSKTISVADASTITLSWTTTNMAGANCDATAGPWSGSKTTTGPNGGGSQPLGPLSGPNTFLFVLTCTNASGSSSSTATVNVAAPVIAEFSVFPAFGTTTTVFTFDGSFSKGDGLSYSWDFGDGSIGSGVKPTHTYSVAGTYTVRLKVTDRFGKTAFAVPYAVVVSLVTGWGGVDCVKDGVATIDCIPAVVKLFINAALTFAGIVAVIIIIHSGFKIVLSSADPKRIEDARHTLVYAIMGLVIVLAAFLLVNLISHLTGVPCIKLIDFNCT